MGVFKKINFGLRKTRNNMSGAIDNVLDSYTSIDEELFDELEEALVMGDVGVTTASEITKRLNERVRKKGLKNLFFNLPTIESTWISPTVSFSSKYLEFYYL